MEPAAKSSMPNVAKKLTSDEMQNLLAFWTYHVENATRLVATPLVVDGMMYVTNSNEVHALDARTGRRIWKYHEDRSKRQNVNRASLRWAIAFSLSRAIATWSR
jgi:glucose dehydrogenase